MLTLASPWAFLLLPLPLFCYLLPQIKQNIPVALRLPFFQALQTIVAGKKLNASVKSNILPFIIWCLLVIALSGPRWIGEPYPVARSGRNIMLVLDISGSMDLPDMLLNKHPVSRLQVVKKAAQEFVNRRIGDRLGLILFGTRAYLQTPLTYDRHVVLERLQDATVGLAGQSTSLGDALGIAVKRLYKLPQQGRVIILLTDGANNSGVLSPLKAAQLAKDEQIKVYTIGLGSEAQAINNIFFNINVVADLDEKTLQEIASITGGQYFRATDSQSLDMIYKTIDQLETVIQAQAAMRPQHDYYPWPLGIALLLFCYWLLIHITPVGSRLQIKPPKEVIP